MLFTETTFIGIDPTAGKRPYVYAAIDHELKLLALGEGRVDAVLAFAAGQSQALVAVCAPRRPNQGVMRREEVRKDLSPQPFPGRWLNFRQVEFLLRQHNIRIPQTLSQEEDCPKWMRMGFDLHRRLEALGYQVYPSEGAELQSLEVYPHASFTVLLDVLPFAKESLAGRLQRQLILFDLGINVSDPMRIFEEITRYRLLHGVLPLDNLQTTGELDALVAAYTAWCAARQPGETILLGDSNEGQVVLPTAKLNERYERSNI